MKLPILFLGSILFVSAAFADDVVTQNVTARKTCAEIKAEIDALSGIEKLDNETADRLTQLQIQYRNSCAPKASGRRTVARNLPVIIKNAESSTSTPSVLSEYLANKKSNCEKLNSEIEKLVASDKESDADTLAAMRGVYDMDCVEKPVVSVPETPEKTEEEWAAEYDANLAAGLCGDGTTPNRFGCCTGETFKDIGNAQFACCPKAGNLCFPPMK